MIEKLNTKYIQVESDSNAKLELASKINELVDTVNHIKEEYDIRCHEIEKRLGVNTKIFRPEEMGYIKLDEDSLRRFHESPEGQEIGRKYKQIVAERTKTDATVSEIAKAEQRFQEMMNHFGKAIQLLRAIAHGEAPEGQPDLRKDPRYTFGGYSNVSLLAQVAMDELEKALAMEEQK